MEALVFLSSGWLKTACVLSALFWVAFRAYQVLSQPVEKLVQVLGLEVPLAPLVSLAGIKADGVLLHWKPPDQRASVLKYVIRVNGIDIGDISPSETSITVENLQPDHHYVIRIVTLNSSNFQAPSVPIRLRTLPADSEQYYSSSPPKQSQGNSEDDELTPTPVVRPNKNLVDIMPAIVAPVMSREHSNSTSRVRRSDPGRRNSPASQTADQARSAQEAAASLETIKELTERLDSLRRELEDMEKQIQEEEQEFHTSKAGLTEKRDEKKAALKEKEDASRDLRKEVATLERQSAAAQTRRTQQEKLLRQKEAERKKVKDDVAKWAREAGELRDTAEKLRQERVDYETSSETRIQELKTKYADEIQTNKSLEEVIREKGTQVRVLEEERKNLEESQEGGEAQEAAESADIEEDKRWNMTIDALQRHYAQAWTLFTEAERANQEALNRLQFLQQRRLSQPQLFGEMSFPEMAPIRRNSLRQRPVSMREPLVSGMPGGFVHSTAVPFNTTAPTPSPPFPTITPYFNPVNGMALPPPSAHTSSFSQADIDSLTGGAPMSPTAGALLPAGLFGDDTGLSDAGDHDDNDHGPPQAPLEPSPNMRNVLPGLGAPGTLSSLEYVQSPSSPVSPQSRSPSAFASPRDSAGQLAYIPNDSLVDSDKRSIRSTSSSFLNNPQSSRFGSIFGLHRQRGKTNPDHGLPLGSLKPSQSQSLPRQDAGGLDPIGTQRRRGSHSGGAWYNAFMPNKAQAAEPENNQKHVATRKRAFNMFGTKGDPWLTSALGLDRPSSPRQGSTKSGEGMALPRPSTESQTRFGWSIDNFGARSSPLGVDWSMNNTTSWSRLPSRRPSVQHGSTASLLNEALLHDDTPDFPSTTRSPTQAPIGTRPQSSASHMPPTLSTAATFPPTPPKQLNPAAPHFKSIFTGSKEEKAEKAKRAAEKAAEKEAKKAEKAASKEEEKKKAKAEKSEKAARKEKGKMLTTEGTASSEWTHELHSPMDPRPSRDAPSISTVDASDASPRESLERSISQTTSENANSSIGKESFMQKLSRKTSSTQFGSTQFLQFSKKNSIFSKKTSEVGTPDEVDEDAGYMGLSGESMNNSPLLGTPKDKSSALSWSSIKRMGKSRDKTPSLHESVTGETTGDEDESVHESVKA